MNLFCQLGTVEFFVRIDGRDFSELSDAVLDAEKLSRPLDLHVEEAEIKFGLKTVGEAGVFAIGKVGGEMNYEVTLKWKKPENEIR